MGKKAQPGARPGATRGAGRPTSGGRRTPTAAATSGRSLGVWIAVVALVVGLGAVGLSRLDSGAARGRRHRRLRRQHPQLDFDLPTFDGGRLQSAALEGKPVVAELLRLLVRGLQPGDAGLRAGAPGARGTRSTSSG